jgi:hypothetical protein
MSNGLNSAASKFTVWGIAGTLFAIAGFAATWLALVEFYGGALTMFFFGIGFLVVAAYFANRTTWKDWQVAISFILGILLILLAVVSWYCEWMRVSFGRADFPQTHYSLKIDKFDTAEQVFGLKPGSTQSGELAKQDTTSKQTWIRWMVTPFLQPTEDLNSKKPVFTSLVYIESVPFDDNYDSFRAFPEVDATATQTGDPVAFLVDEKGEGIWLKPKFRQLDVSMSGENDSIPIVYVDKPNKGERLVIFMPISKRNDSSQLPDLRQCFPNQHHLEVK